MASIRRRGNSFIITVSNGLDHDKKPKMVYETFKPELYTKTGKLKADSVLQKEAESYAADLERRIKTGGYNYHQGMTFGDLYQRWLDDWYNVAMKPSAALRKSYKDHLEWYVLPDLKYKKITEIKKTTLERLYIKLSTETVKPGQKTPLKKSSINKVHQAVRCIFGFAVDDELTEKDPCNRLKISAILPEDEISEHPDCFTFEEAEEFMRFVRNPYCREVPSITRNVHGQELKISSYSAQIEPNLMWEVFFTIAIHEGLRRGEILALTWNDILFNSIKDDSGKAYSQIVVNKTVTRDESNKQYVKNSPKTKNGIRTKTIMTETAEVLARYKKEMDSIGAMPLFIHRDTFINVDLGTPSTKFKDLLRYYNRSNPKNQLPDIHLHSLRKTSITFEYNAEIPESTIAQRHGHSDKNITRHYKQLTDESCLAATKKKEEYYRSKREALDSRPIKAAAN